MGNRMRSMYAGLASRFAHLALGAKAEDEEEERAEEETEEGDEEEAREKECAEEEKKGKKGNKAKKSKSERADEEDVDGDEEEESDEEEGRNDRDAAASARSAERARWASVMSSKAAAGRIPLACSLLADTDMDAEKICAALAVSPTEARQGLAARMAAVPRPDVGSSAAGAGQPDVTTPRGRAAEMKKAYDKARGIS